MKTSTTFRFLSFLYFAFFFSSIFARGLHFSVKVPLQQIKDFRILNNYKGNISYFKESAYIGKYQHYLLAMKAKQELNSKGITGTEIKAFFNYAPISLEDAFALLDNKNYQDIENKGITLTNTELNALLDSVSNKEYFYTVQIGLFSENNINSFFNFPKQVNESITDKGQYRYTFGTFKSYNDAKDALNMIKEYGLTDAFVIAFDKTTRIPISRALELEQKSLETALEH